MARKKPYQWRIGDAPPKLGEHSETKHQTIFEYLVTYCEVLSQSYFVEQLRLNIIDGFCGGGEYISQQTGEVVYGSPIMSINAVRQAQEKISFSKQKPFIIDANWYFIDINSDHINYLDDILNRHCFHDEHQRIKTIQNSFDEALPQIVRDINNRGRNMRSLFLLDQYGYTDVPVHTIKLIRSSLPKSECILTIAVDRMFDFFREDSLVVKHLKELGLDLYGLPKKDDIAHGPYWRHVVERCLVERLGPQTGYKNYTPFFIVSRNDNRAYWLMHFSNHHRARDEMIGIHRKLGNSFRHYGEHGMNMFGFDPRNNIESILPLDFTSAHDATIKRSLESGINDTISRLGGATTFSGLLSAIANSTTARIEDISSTLIEKQSYGEIEIIKPDGKRSQSTKRLNEDFILKNPSQVSFYFMNRK